MVRTMYSTEFVRGVPSLECFDYSARVMVLFGIMSQNSSFDHALSHARKKNGDMPVSEIHSNAWGI